MIVEVSSTRKERKKMESKEKIIFISETVFYGNICCMFKWQIINTALQNAF